MIIAMAHDIRVVLIKLADRLHNMRTLDHLAADRQEEISRETLEIYAPIAHRLGIYWLKSELEDFAFRYLNPSAYASLKAYVGQAPRRARRIYSQRSSRSSREASGGVGGQSGSHRPPQAFLFDPHQDAARGAQLRRDLRSRRVSHHRADSVRECYEALGVVHANWKPIPGPLQGLYRPAQGQHVPVAAYHRDRAARAADGSADSHARDARGGRARNRRALELQGGRRRARIARPSASPGCGG